MKKLLIASLIGLLPTLLTAQEIARNNKTNIPTELVTATNPTEPTTRELRKSEREKVQFAKTTKAFARDFKKASDVHWSSGKTGYTASFRTGDVKTVAWYNKGGRLLYKTVSYGADKLPARERAVIQEAYDGYKITHVNEVHQDGILVYVVHLETDRNIKLVTVRDGVTNIYRAFKKQY